MSSIERKAYHTGEAVKTNIRDSGEEEGQEYCWQNLSSSQILTGIISTAPS